jgi:hypothetical protein
MWQPDNFSEDHLSNFLVQGFTKTKRWHLVYYNPPHGSWKFISLIRGNFEYRQVGPKRGVGRLKRPDVALQKLSREKNSVTLFLIESKVNRGAWDSDLPALLKAYFEGADADFKKSKGVRWVPFWHRREKGIAKWEELHKDDPDRRWFAKCDIDYIFGFAYTVGLTSQKRRLSSERMWMKESISTLDKPVSPLVMMAVGWWKKNFKPFIIQEYSETFPESIRRDIEAIFSNYVVDSKIKLPSLDEFI